MSRWLAAVVMSVLAWPVLPVQASAEEHIYSYDPVSASARTLTSTGLSFQFERGLLGGVHVERIIQTGDRGAAELRPAAESELGPGGLKAALGDQRPAGPLYEIRPEAEGRAFVHAVCPGAERAWLVIGPLERFGHLTIQAVGRDPGAAAARSCSTMDFSFYSDWRLPERESPRVRSSLGGRGG
jgi:hypothetical protein